MKKAVFLMLLLMMSGNIKASAGRGCCSHHGGVAGCSDIGRQVCNDGTLSPSCRCTPPARYGCTDSKAYNYDSYANMDDGSCEYYTYGCTDANAYNYNPGANKDDGSCKYHIYGCMDINAKNYNEDADIDGRNCEYADDDLEGYNEKDNDDVKETTEEEYSDSEKTIIGLIEILGAGGIIYAFKNNKKTNK